MRAISNKLGNGLIRLRLFQGEIDRLKAALAENWREACAYDGFPRDTRFAEFSKGNPHAQARDVLFAELSRVVSERAELAKELAKQEVRLS